MKQPVLEVRNVTKLFGSVIALHDVSAQVNAGEISVLLTIAPDGQLMPIAGAVPPPPKDEAAWYALRARQRGLPLHQGPDRVPAGRGSGS